MPKWTAADIPPQHGRVAIVTGANSGLGLHTALALARAGARVVLACRDTGRGEAALARVRAEAPGAEAELRRLDLADLASVRAFAAETAAADPRIDLLVNNAGVMALPERRTADGFEMQLGTNHLGHFALTGLVLPALHAAPEARVVTVSSIVHRMGRMRWDDLQWRHGYKRWPAYGQAKLANLLFAFELQRRAAAAGWALRSVAAHPGYASTNLQATGPLMAGQPLRARAMGVANRLVAQSDAMGALPSLYAATAPDVPGGAFVGPDGRGEMRGHPRFVAPSGAAADEAAAARLWALSEELTGVAYDFAGVPAAVA